MDAERISIAETCLHAAHDGSLSFPEIVGKLIAAGFEGYTVDYRRNSQSCYLPDGDNVTMDMQPSVGKRRRCLRCHRGRAPGADGRRRTLPTTATSLSARRRKPPVARDTSSRSWAAALFISAARLRPMSSTSQSDGGSGHDAFRILDRRGHSCHLPRARARHRIHAGEPRRRRVYSHRESRRLAPTGSRSPLWPESDPDLVARTGVDPDAGQQIKV